MNTNRPQDVTIKHFRRISGRSDYPPPQRQLATACDLRRLISCFIAISAWISSAPVVAQGQDRPAGTTPGALETRVGRHEIEPLSVGSRVRILSHVPGLRPRVGHILESDSALLRLRFRNGPDESVSWELVRDVQVLSKRRSYVPAFVGLLIGGAAGFYLHKRQLDSEYEQDTYNGLTALVRGAPVGAGLGFVVGFAVGGEKWRTVGAGPFLIPSR